MFPAWCAVPRRRSACPRRPWVRPPRASRRRSIAPNPCHRTARAPSTGESGSTVAPRHRSAMPPSGLCRPATTPPRPHRPPNHRPAKSAPRVAAAPSATPATGSGWHRWAPAPPSAPRRTRSQTPARRLRSRPPRLPVDRRCAAAARRSSRPWEGAALRTRSPGRTPARPAWEAATPRPTSPHHWASTGTPRCAAHRSAASRRRSPSVDPPHVRAGRPPGQAPSLDRGVAPPGRPRSPIHPNEGPAWKAAAHRRTRWIDRACVAR